MAAFWNFRRIGAAALCLLLWALLLPSENARSLHEFQEMSFHGSESDPSADRFSGTIQRGHDCHSCLVSHPKTFAGLTLKRAVDSPLQVDGAKSLRTDEAIPFLQRPSPQKRSPPV